jgi:RHS repeat-associated protein
MFRRFRFCCATVAGVTLCALSASAAGVTADVTTTPVAYTAATTNTTDLSFNGILQNGTTFQDFTLVTVQGVVFTAQSGSAPVNVTSASYYFPTVYPADFLTDGSNANANNTLNVTLPAPVYALALDYGSIEAASTGTGVLTFSNGFVYNLTAIPGLTGSTAFIGLVFNTPVTSFSYTVTGGSYILQDLLLSTPGPPSSIPTGFVLLGVVNPAITGPVPCAKAQSEGPDPVICATGNLVELATDLTVRGRGRYLQLARTYNSQDAASATGPDAAGFGWFHSYAASLTPGAGGNATVVQQGNGSTVPFVSSGAVFTAPPYVIATLVQNKNGTYTFTLPNQTADIFSSTGQLMVRTDRDGYQTSLAYNASGQLVTVTDPAGRALTFTYGSNGLVSSVTDPIGRKVTYAYDASDNLTAVTDAGGNITHYAYDASHRLITVTDPNGGVTSNTYDNSNRVISQTDPAGRSATFAYAGTTTTITDGNGNVESETFAGSRLTSVTQGVGTTAAATLTFINDAAGNRISVTDADGHIWTATYDTHGNQLTTTDPLSRTTTSTYDAQNNLLTQTDPSGVTTTRTYNAHGNLATVSRPLTGTTQMSTTTYQYGDTSHPGDVTAVVDALGQTWSRSYDANGDLTQQVDPTGDTLTSSYNGIGWLTGQVTPRGHASGANPANFTLTKVYSQLGELLSSTDQLGHVTTYTYDGDRNMVSATDALGHTTGFAYDPDNEQTKVTRPDGSVLTTAFDSDGNMIGQTDGLGKTTSYAYDPLNRLVQTTDPLGRQTQYAYDGVGNRIKIVDAAGQTTAFTYDAANEVTGISYSDGKTPSVSFTYDADGRRTGMTDGTGSSTYQYDSLYRLIASKDGAGNQVSYSYDLRADLTGLIYPSGKQVTRGFDGTGRLTSVMDWLGNTSTFQYDDDSHPVAIAYGNGVSGAFGYDQTDRSVSMSYSHTSQSLLAFNYTRNGLGQVTADTGGPTGAVSYSYYSINQLISDNQTPLTYDHADNITELEQGPLNPAKLTYDLANELLSESGGSSGTSSLTYDARGNRLKQAGPGEPRTFQYDQANRLITYGANATYAYNGDGLRERKAVSGDAEAFAWNLAEGLPQLLADGKTQFIYGPRGQPLEQVAADGAVLWFHQDQLGSTRMLTNQQGKTSATYNYDAYGQRLGLGQGGAGLPALTPLLYAGQYTDAESGLQYMQARYYDPSAGQFLTRDPQYMTTRSPYLYASGDPVNRRDPSGADDDDDSGGGSSGGGQTCPPPVEVANALWDWLTGTPSLAQMQQSASNLQQAVLTNSLVATDPNAQQLVSDLDSLAHSASSQSQFQDGLNKILSNPNYSGMYQSLGFSFMKSIPGYEHIYYKAASAS